ncbi:MAG: hypothetical protein FJ387_02300 [Verrucomicrobia bacterium]|nr:hypothetical protein [Verrucomicrobiota bacterium]
MRLLEGQVCTREHLVADLAPKLLPLVFRASDGATCCGRLATLQIYPATPTGEEPLLGRLVDRALAPDADPHAAIASKPGRLALQLLPHGGGPPADPTRRIRARRTLARVLADPRTGPREHDEAVAALAQLNLPRIPRRIVTGLTFLLGVSEGDPRQIRVATLDDTGHTSVPGFRPESRCWVRLRHGRDLAHEIAHSLRPVRLDPGQPLRLLSERSDWELSFQPQPGELGTHDLRAALKADAALAFPPESVAIVATPENRGDPEGYYLAALDASGSGLLAELPAGSYRLFLAWAPKIALGDEPEPRSVATAHVWALRTGGRLTLRTADPALENSRCVLVQGQPHHGVVRLLAEAVLTRQPDLGDQPGQAQAHLSLAPASPSTGPQTRRRRGGLVLTQGTVASKSALPVPRAFCLVLL